MSQLTLANRAAELQAELDAIQRVQKTLADLRETFARFPALRQAFGNELSLIAAGNGNPFVIVEGSQRTSVVTAIAELESGSLNADKIETYLIQRAEPATVKEIAKATGIPMASVRHTFYIRHPNRFEKVGTSGAGKKVRWQLPAAPLPAVKQDARPHMNGHPETASPPAQKDRR